MNPTISDLVSKRDGFIEQARAAFGAGKLEEGQKLSAAAEKAQKAITGLGALDTMVPLPGTNGALVNQMAGSNKANGGNGNGADQSSAQLATKAAYLSRFGDTDEAVKAILRDMHGPNYDEAYVFQRQAFKTYLRFGEKKLDAAQATSLHDVVLTPAMVKMALNEGFDSVASLKATMVEGINSLGGYAVPVDFQARVIERLATDAVIRNRASVDRTSRDMVEIPVSIGGDDQYSSAVRVTWVDETPTAGTSDTNMRFGLESIPIHTSMAETGLSRNMVEDAAFDIENYLVRKFAEASDIDEDNRFATGTGAGAPQGLLPGGINALGLTERNSGSASAITWDGLIALQYAIPSRYRKKAVWIANRSSYEAIAKLRAAADGSYLWNPYQFQGGTNLGPETRLLNFPTLEQENMPDAGADAYPVLFGDLTGYQIFDRVGMTVERYLDSATARTNTIMYVMRRRLGGQVVEPWRFAVLLCHT